MEIREIKEAELGDLLNLYSYLHASDDPLPEKAIVDTVWQEIRANPDIKYFGLYDGGRLVSSCNITITPNLTRGLRPYGVIENVVTHADFRRKGYGQAVLRYALEYARSRNCYKVMLMSGRKDEGVYRFYESAGFDRHAKQAFLVRF
ncbi:MAG: GNAT family N-acetyltransferase [Dehalococcoidales bacterium]|jgi:GNAT superfamily N-acetyltransferase